MTAKTTKTAKMFNDLLNSQKVDRARIQQLEARLAESNTRQAAAVTAAVREAVIAAETQFRAEIDRRLHEVATEHDRRTELAVGETLEVSNQQIVALKQELCGVRQLLSAADASNEELRNTVEELGNTLDKTAQEAANLAEERAVIAKQREELTHILDTVRERLRGRERASENAILNRRVLSGAAPARNFKA